MIGNFTQCSWRDQTISCTRWLNISISFVFLKVEKRITDLHYFADIIYTIVRNKQFIHLEDNFRSTVEVPYPWGKTSEGALHNKCNSPASSHRARVLYHWNSFWNVQFGLKFKGFRKSLEVWQKFSLGFIAQGLGLGVGNPVPHRWMSWCGRYGGSVGTTNLE